MEERAGQLREILSSHRISLSDQQIFLLLRHLELVLAANEMLNLTAIREFDTGLVLHIEDSLTALEELGCSPEGPLGDLGSGAGYPGIPLAIASGRATTLIDSSQKKARAVEGMIREIGLSGSISVCDQRVEDLARELPESYAVLTARALSSLPSLLELASPLLTKGGRFIALKAAPEEDELDRGDRVAELVGMSLCSTRKVALSNGDTRLILSYVKDKDPALELPRRTGVAQKRPLA